MKDIDFASRNTRSKFHKSNKENCRITMTRWRQIGQTWCKWPAQPVGLIEMIGGSYLAASPQISYRRLLDDLAKRNLAVHAWSYIPGLDHQAQANHAWRSMRSCKKSLESRIAKPLKIIRLGHSLGCKLHLLAPDGGRNSKGLITMSFNNFGANKSIPLLGKLAPRLGFYSEFSPSPEETLRLIRERYLQQKNLLISFEEDQLDQTPLLFNCLQTRQCDDSEQLHLNGDHLTPASAGFRHEVLGQWADDKIKRESLNRVVDEIYKWSS